MQTERFIVHVDMDAFFASVEQRDNPGLQNKPVVVGADPRGGRGRGVVSTASYEARQYGIHSAMPISIAYKKCPYAIFLLVDMEKYSLVSRQIYKILYNFTPDIEPVSIDEFFLDIGTSYHLFGSPRQACLLMKSRIKSETELTASIGLAPTKMAAKIASDLKKPDGFVEVTKEKLFDFLWPLDVDKISGLGQRSKVLLNGVGVKTIGELAKKDVHELMGLFGKNGFHFWQLANGLDNRDVQTKPEAKSISNEITFQKDTLDKDRIESALMALCEKVSWRLRQDALKCRTITLKIRLCGFVTYTRSVTISEPTNFIDTISSEIKKLYENFELKNKPVRLVGVKTSSFSPVEEKTSLFYDDSGAKQEQIHKVMDTIRDKFGDGAIHRAGSIAKNYSESP